MNHRPPSHFLLHPAFETQYNSHFGEGLVSADGFLGCQNSWCDGSRFLRTRIPSRQPLATPVLFSPLPVQLAGKGARSSRCNTRGTARWLQSSHQRCLFPPNRVGLFCRFSPPAWCPFSTQMAHLFHKLFSCAKRDTFNLCVPHWWGGQTKRHCWANM